MALVRRKDCVALSSLIGAVALVRFTTVSGLLAAESV